MKQTSTIKRRNQLAMSVIAFTLVAAIGGSLAVAPAVSAREPELFNRVRDALGGKPAQQQVQSLNQNENARLGQLVQKGGQEIDRRLQSLERLSDKINAAVNLSAADKASLTAEIASVRDKLTMLRAQLSGIQNIRDAQVVIKSIKEEYNTYALVMPKIHIVKLAEDIMGTDDKLLDLAGKLEARIASAKDAGKDVSALEAQLTSILSYVGSAQKIAEEVKERSIAIALTDSRESRTTLLNLYQQLKSAREDNKAAFADARSIVQSLKTL